MKTIIVRGGKFNHSISSKELSMGLRPFRNSPRNDDYALECGGAVGIDGSLQVIESLTRIDTSIITDGFPFPQFLPLVNVMIVCGLKKIYEWDGSSLTLMYTAAEAGGLWTAADFRDYVYMSNGKIAVVRNPESKVYSLSSTLPSSTSICNFNSQVIIGSPDVDGLGVDLMLPAGVITLTTSLSGTV